MLYYSMQLSFAGLALLDVSYDDWFLIFCTAALLLYSVRLHLRLHLRYIGLDSRALVAAAPREQENSRPSQTVTNVLDLCTGSGIQGGNRRVWVTDPHQYGVVLVATETLAVLLLMPQLVAIVVKYK